MIQFDSVSKYYTNKQQALNNVNLHIEKGEMVFLTGHSGAGKSTVLKLINLMEQTSRGHILVNGKNLSKVKQSEIPYIRRAIGTVFQNPHLLADRTVFDNIALPLVIAEYRHQDISRRVRAALAKVGLLGKERLLPVALSGGEQQRVGIARAVVSKPRLLLADEPTGNLDPGLSKEIMTLFEQFNQVGVTVLIASHDLSLIACMRHRMLTLKEGSLTDV